MARIRSRRKRKRIAEQKKKQFIKNRKERNAVFAIKRKIFLNTK
jgi:hypothetical protein